MTVKWLTEEIIHAVHRRSLADHGGADGLRDAGLLDSALQKAKQRYHYEKPDMFDLASAYATGIIKNHAFVDGNKRTAFYAAYVFLGLNGYELTADEDETTAIVLALAASEVSEQEFSAWLKAKSEKIEVL